MGFILHFLGVRISCFFFFSYRFLVSSSHIEINTKKKKKVMKLLEAALSRKTFGDLVNSASFLLHKSIF